MLPQAPGVDNAALLHSLANMASVRYSLPPRWHSAEQYRDRMLAARTLREGRAIAAAGRECIQPGWGAMIWGAVIAKATDGKLTLDMDGLHTSEPLGYRNRIIAVQAMAAMLAHYWHKHGLNPYREALQKRPLDGCARLLDLEAACASGRSTMPEARGSVGVMGLGPAIAKRWFFDWYDPSDPRNALAAARRRQRHKADER